MARVIALSCALLLCSLGYALACSPDIGDPWFNLSVLVNTKTLPKNFVLRADSIENVNARDCILADGTRFEGYATRKFTSFAKSYMIGDGRPAHVKLPKPDTVKLEVYCDKQRRITRGTFSYLRMGPSCAKWVGYDKWVGHMELALDAVAPYLKVEPAERYCSVTGDLFIERVAPAMGFCTMSAQQVFSDHPAREKQVWSHGPLSLASLTGAEKRVGVDYKGRVTAAEAAQTKTFEVYLDCYTSKNVIEAKVSYALNKSYDPTIERRSAEACNPKH